MSEFPLEKENVFCISTIYLVKKKKSLFYCVYDFQGKERMRMGGIRWDFPFCLVYFFVD